MPGIGRRREELQEADLVVVEPAQHAGERLQRVAVEADHEEGDHLDAARAQLREILAEAARAIELLRHRRQALLRQALEADRQHARARAGHQIEELRIARHVDRGLAHPLDAQRDQGAQHLLGGLGVRERIVVHEEEAARAEGRHALRLGDELVHRTRPEGALIVGLHRAVLAGMRAAAREEDGPEEVHAVEPAAAEGVGLEQRQRPGIDLGQAAQVVPARRAVDAAAASGLEIREDLGPDVLGLACDDRVGVRAATRRA